MFSRCITSPSDFSKHGPRSWIRDNDLNNQRAVVPLGLFQSCSAHSPFERRQTGFKWEEITIIALVAKVDLTLASLLKCIMTCFEIFRESRR